MAVYGQKIAKKGKPGAKLAVWGGTVLFVSYINFALNSRVLTTRWYGGMKFYKSNRGVSLVCVMTVDGFLEWCHSFGS